MPITFDYGLVAEASKLEAAGSEQAGAYQRLQEKKKAGELGFARLPYQEDSLVALEELAAQVRTEFRNLVVIGIGGSDLGTRAVQRALHSQFYNLQSVPRLFFLGDTTDPVAIQEVLDCLELAETGFLVVSKSGNTVEQMSVFVYARQLLLDQLGEEAARQHIIVLTDPEKGTLREIVAQEGYRSLPIPPEVGGRFSVLSSVSLFPLAVLGVDIRQLLAGARWLDQEDGKGSQTNPAFLYATWNYLAYQNGQTLSVMMPYAYSLREFGFWFRQLWAESLGKKLDTAGQERFCGPTPIAAVGPTDQHSQLQLYMEGPDNKIFTFLTVEEPAVDLKVPAAFPEQEGVAYLKGHSFQEILMAEQRSTAHALSQAGRSSFQIRLQKLDAYHLGALLYFFELATAYAGELFQVNAFDQPGVEMSKQYMYGLLGRPGFEDWQIPSADTTYQINL